MDANLVERIETNAERGASALLAGAVGYALYEGLSGFVFEPQLAAYAAAAAAGAYLLSTQMLKLVGRPRARLRVPVFDLREFDAFGPGELLLTEQLNGELILTDRLEDELLLTDRVDGELLLTDADRFLPAAAVPSAGDPFVLDDVLAAIGPDSRVVRLFDRTAMPTPGQLRTRIDDHLGQGSAATASMDASQALSDALAELKRSLR